MGHNKTSRFTEHLLFPVGALITLGITWQEPQLFSSTGFVVAFGLLIAMLGVPHGALDPWIAQNLGLKKTPKNTLLFLITYIAIAAVIVAVWAVAPAVCLSGFLLVSAFHFAGDWKTKGLLHWPAGALLLLMPIGFQTELVAQIFEQLSGPAGYELAYTLALPKWLLAGLLASLLIAFGFRKQWLTVSELLVLLIIAARTPPLVYFALYFCLLHSPRHLMALFRSAGNTAHRHLINMMVLFTLATLMLAGFLAWLWADLPLDSMVMRLVFIGLAALTVPHVLLIALAQLREKSVHTSS